MPEQSTDQTFDSRRFRQVLGHYPTGVTVVTAVNDGVPTGMAVGSFTSVSLDPPLVAFFPEKSSTTFPQIREAGTFCVNVLAAHQEQACRAFAMRGHDRFDGVEWNAAPTGSPIIDGVVAWVDCDIESVEEYGDHYIVLGRVRALDTAGASMPLMFFRGGYGKFSAQSLVVAGEPDLVRVVRLSELARPWLERLASDLGMECTVSAAVDGNLVVLASAGTTQGEVGPPMVGRRIPMLPPLGSQFMAWESDEKIAEWLARSPRVLESSDRARYESVLAQVRERGWLCYLSGAGFEQADQFARWSAGEGIAGAREEFERAVALLEPGFDLFDEEGAAKAGVRRIIVPVLTSDGVAPVALNAHLDGRARAPEELTVIKDRLRETAKAVAEAIDLAESARLMGTSA